MDLVNSIRKSLSTSFKGDAEATADQQHISANMGSTSPEKGDKGMCLFFLVSALDMTSLCAIWILHGPRHCRKTRRLGSA